MHEALHGRSSAADGLGFSPKPCNSLLEIPRVTILFLSRGAMAHEPLWNDWLASAAGLLPLQYLQVCH